MPTSAAQIVREKLAQASQLLDDHDLDLWLTFVRETSLIRDPALDLIYPYDVTWQSAFLIGRGGKTIAIVGRFDTDSIESLGAYDQVIGYDQSIRPALIESLRQLAPRTIAVNSSESDTAADGLTVGMRKILDRILDEAMLNQAQVLSAQNFLGSLRGCKSPTEVERIRQAIQTTERLYAEVGAQLKPGVTERQLADFLQARVSQEGLGYAWDPHNNPIVNTGPDSPIGHTAPGDRQLEPGHLVHFDFGIKQAGFCSDLQRMWYLPATGEQEVPVAVENAFQATRTALLAGAEMLRPGIQGWEVDQAARGALVEAGFPVYQHAFGHHIGRVAHDGATTLGPRWDRYGETPYGIVEAGNVFAIELGVEVPGHGWMYLEENVLVHDNELEWLSTPQDALWLIES